MKEEVYIFVEFFRGGFIGSLSKTPLNLLEVLKINEKIVISSTVVSKEKWINSSFKGIKTYSKPTIKGTIVTYEVSDLLVLLETFFMDTQSNRLIEILKNTVKNLNCYLETTLAENLHSDIKARTCKIYRKIEE